MTKETTKKTTAKKTTATKAEPKKTVKAAAKKATEAKVEAPVEAKAEPVAEVKAPKAPKAAKASAPAAEPMPRPAPVRLDWELAAAWEVVRVVERGDALRDGEMAEHFATVISPHLRNFIQFGQSSLNHYETNKLVEGLLRQSAEGLSGDFFAGDRVRFSLDGQESQGFVYGNDGKQLRILAVDLQGGDFVGLVSGDGKGKAQVLGIVASAA